MRAARAEVGRPVRQGLAQGTLVVPANPGATIGLALKSGAIERAEKLLGKGRIKYIHPDCGFWMLPRSVADGKIRALAAGRDMYEGR